jgi:hypothetical protein
MRSFGFVSHFIEMCVLPALTGRRARSKGDGKGASGLSNRRANDVIVGATVESSVIGASDMDDFMFPLP